ncbi:MAG: phosphoglucosamine mutase [Acidobacteria bacterium]|nr:phosphoglucosamine mutase [Acidobacteriota bacterium]
MAKQLFGTDGIRGVAGEPPLDDRTVFAVGLALGESLRAQDEQSNVLIGMDTRQSGPKIAGLLAAGLLARNVPARFAGVISTPGVAYLTRSGEFSAGIMISASHNPFRDNGIKVFGSSGAKLDDAREATLETAILRLRESDETLSAATLTPEPALDEAYLDHLVSAAKAAPGLIAKTVIVDCAHGAASALAPKLFEQLRVDARIFANQPDGSNINEACGSMHMQSLQDRVERSGGAIGVAFDGDADRALFVAEDGSLVDGDVILLLAARYLAASGALPGNHIVTTIMANMGLEKALADDGISMARTPVGDKYVLEEMLRSGAALGGEQSGHIIFRAYASTGDGLLTALMMLRILAAENKPLSELKQRLKVFPQALENVRVSHQPAIEDVPVLAEAVERSSRELNGLGRIVVRYSGTEPLARIMVEAETRDLVDRHTQRLVEVFKRELGA